MQRLYPFLLCISCSSSLFSWFPDTGTSISTLNGALTLDIPLCLSFFLGITFAWQMVQMAQQIFTGSVLEKQSKAEQNKTKQNKNIPAARLMTFWHHIMWHQSSGWGKHHRKKIDVELAGLLIVFFESYCFERPQRGGTKPVNFLLSSWNLPLSPYFNEKELLLHINIFSF